MSASEPRRSHDPVRTAPLRARRDRGDGFSGRSGAPDRLARGRAGGRGPSGPLPADRPRFPAHPPRRRLEPRPVAGRARGARAGFRAHGEGRLQHLLGRHLRVGGARARGGPLRDGLARRGAGRAREARLPRLPRHPERSEAALDVGEVRGGAADRRAGPARAARLAAQPLLHVAGLPREGTPHQHEAGRALQGPQGARGLAHLERVQRRLLLRLLPRRVPGVAQDPLRRPRRAQPGLLVGVLGPDVPVVGPDRPARVADGRAEPRLGPFRHAPDRGLHEGRDRPPEGGDTRAAGHHQHDGLLHRPRLLALRRDRAIGWRGTRTRSCGAGATWRGSR